MNTKQIGDETEARILTALIEEGIPSRFHSVTMINTISYWIAAIGYSEYSVKQAGSKMT